MHGFVLISEIASIIFFIFFFPKRSLIAPSDSILD